MPSPDALNLSMKSSPYIQKQEDAAGKALKPTVKAYKNAEFLASHEGRLIRIMCEFDEPQQRLKRNYIRSTVLFFGSARSMTKQQFDRTMMTLEAEREAAESDAARTKADKEISRLRSTEWMCEWMDGIEKLARMVAQFAQDEQELINRSFLTAPDYFRLGDIGEASLAQLGERFHDMVVTTGGGPGFMEAANRGAASVDGVKTMGMGISLPFEKGLNAYVSDDLVFEFHYFFTRKFWMMYSCRAIVVAPGGFGTLDELFELLTLRQTKKIPAFPVILFCKEFWQTVVNWQALADYGVISQDEVSSLCFTDSPDEAIAFIRNFYTSML